MSTMPNGHAKGQAEFGEKLVAFGLALGPVVALGFSRFAYSLLLPPMRDQLHWNYSLAGGLNTSNAIGYIIGAIIAAWVAKWLGDRRAYIGMMAISSLVLLLCGVTSTYSMLLVLRFIGGITTAITFVIGSGLAARIRPSLLPVYFAGPGLGIIISGIVVPAALDTGDSGWRLGWVLLGIAAIISLILSWFAVRALPEHPARHAAMLKLSEFRKLSPTFFGYLLFGAGYIAYMTFVIALLHSQGLNHWLSAIFWIILGIASAVFIGLWGRFLPRCKGGWGPSIVSVIVLIGTLPVLLFPGFGSALVSAVLFGSSFMAGPTAVTGLCRKHLPPPVWTAGIAVMTAGFAIGQALGPLVSGLISDFTGGVTAGLWLAPILLLLATIVALLQQEHHLLEEHHKHLEHNDPKSVPSLGKSDSSLSTR